MRSTPSRRLLPALLLLSCLSTGCATTSMPASIARTDRPALPPLAETLTATETIKPLTAQQTGELVSVPKGFLTELLERFAEALAAIERANTRALAVRQERICVNTILRTGAAPAGC